MPAPGSDVSDFPPGPGLAHRWWVALPCVVAGTLLPVALADVVAVWHNRVSRPGATLSDVIGDFAPAVGLWSGLALLAGLVAMLVTRHEVTTWPRIAVLTAAPSLVALAIVGAVSGLGSGRWYLVVDVLLAGLLGVGGFLLVRFGVRRLVGQPGVDTLDSGLDVRIDLSGADHLMLRHDRLVVVEGSDRWAVSWYDFRTVRSGKAGDVEILAAGGRSRSLTVDQGSLAVAAVRLRAQWARRQPRFAARRDEHRRVHGSAEMRRRAEGPRQSYVPGQGLGVGGLTVLFMVVMPVAAVVLLIALVNAAPADRPQMIIGLIASVVIGTWAHIRFWRRRAARRYLAAHPEDA